MRYSLIFYLIFVCLLCIGAWGLLRIVDDSTFAGSLGSADTLSTLTKKDLHDDLLEGKAQTQNRQNFTQQEPNDQHLIKAQTKYTNHALRVIEKRLAQGDYSAAADYVNQEYSNFSAKTLTQIQATFKRKALSLQHQGTKSEALRLSLATTEAFNDLQPWLNVSRLAIDLQQWQTAFDATLKASLLQSDSIGLELLQNNLITIAANYRSSLEQQGNALGVHKIYDSLYNAYPNYPRYQLELALSHLRLNRYNEARPLLTQLQYDDEFSEVSRMTLAKLDEQNTVTDRIVPSDNVTVNQTRNIEIPLKRLGTNLLANVQINQRIAPLLLDTGASITALDTGLIARLNLAPTGRSITISTANGVRKATLYRARKIRLGRFLLKDHVIAGIDLSDSSYFSGLLGTDILNAVSSDYSYIIDNQKSALIFKPKKPLRTSR